MRKIKIRPQVSFFGCVLMWQCLAYPHLPRGGSRRGLCPCLASRGLGQSVERLVFGLSHGPASRLGSLCLGRVAFRLHVHLTLSDPQPFGNEDVEHSHHPRFAWGVRHSGIPPVYHPLPTDLSPSVGADPGTMDCELGLPPPTPSHSSFSPFCCSPFFLPHPFILCGSSFSPSLFWRCK